MHIEKLIPGGQGITTLETGQKAFFWNALPGETVTEFEITKKKSKYIEAVATKIENPSKFRITPKDSCYLSTSPWQIMDYSYELEQKSLLLEENFRQAGLDLYNFFENHAHTGKPSLSAKTPTADHLFGYESPERPTGVLDANRENIAQVQTNLHDFHYRNKMEYSLYYDFTDEKIHLAFHKRGSHAKIKIETSSLEHPEIFEKAQTIVADLNARGEEARKYQSLLLRCNQAGRVEGGLFEKGKPHPKFNNLSDKIFGHEYSYSPNGFFQINLPVYELALTEIKKHIETENVLDLYAGVGTIGLSVARDKNLTLVEVDKAAYAELEKNCRDVISRGHAQAGKPSLSAKTPVATGVLDADHENNISTVLSRSEDTLSFINPDQTVILDPPRAGCDAKLLEKLLETTPAKIIYLSCNPATQARDVKTLTATKNYEIAKVQPYNFFPRTPHLENLVVLTRKSVL